MSDLIDRTVLKSRMYTEAFESDTNMQRWDSGCWIRYKLFEKVVDNMPTVPYSPRWHRVDEPPKGYGAFAACCVYDGKIYWFKAIYLDGNWLREMDGVELPVNYWMEIPEPPKEDA